MRTDTSSCGSRTSHAARIARTWVQMVDGRLLQRHLRRLHPEDALIDRVLLAGRPKVAMFHDVAGNRWDLLGPAG
jgi:hypothetical protein